MEKLNKNHQWKCKRTENEQFEWCLSESRVEQCEGKEGFFFEHRGVPLLVLQGYSGHSALFGEDEWYFFSLRDRKFRNGSSLIELWVQDIGKRWARISPSSHPEGCKALE
ncbi:hypothetical protein Scep_004875 [Stephania cephalantha]|uniref:Uncharacterized protein n=1 Tax=Stephania cephalantha TaxID=152367 RepID=A0AAP0KT95_9MAGN